MSASLIFHSPLSLAIVGARNCKDSFTEEMSEGIVLAEGDFLSAPNADLLGRLLRMGHESVLEHVNYTYKLVCSRACLQQLVRTRIASYSVQSTRFTLHKLKVDNVDKYLYKLGNPVIDAMNVNTLKDVINFKGKNDVLKYSVPDALLTKVIMTLNLRSLRHLIETRTGRDVMEEYRVLVQDMIKALPPTHRVLVEDCIRNDESS